MVISSILMVLFFTRRAITKDSYEEGSNATKTNALIFSSIFSPTLRRSIKIFWKWLRCSYMLYPSSIHSWWNYLQRKRVLVRDFSIYNSPSFDHSAIKKVSPSTWITTSSIRYKQMVLTVCIYSHSQAFSSMMADFFSYKRTSINPCWMSTSFILVYHKEKLLFTLNWLISILIVLVFSISNSDQHHLNLDHLVPLIHDNQALIPIVVL